MLRVVAADASDAMQAKPAAPKFLSYSATLIWTALVLAAMAVAALSVDLPVAAYVKAHGLRGEFSRVIRLAEVFGWGGTVTIIIATAAVLDRRGWRVVVPLALSSLGAGLVADGMKLLIGRWRPSAPGSFVSAGETFIGWLPLLHPDGASVSKHAMQSFPSAHAATAAGLAAALSMLYPRGRWLFVAFAAMAMIQRVEAQAHWCSDVLAGAALGCSIAAVVQSFRIKVQRRWEDAATSSESVDREVG